MEGDALPVSQFKCVCPALALSPVRDYHASRSLSIANPSAMGGRQDAAVVRQDLGTSQFGNYDSVFASLVVYYAIQAQVLVSVPCLSIVTAASYPFCCRLQGGANPRFWSRK